MKKYLRISLTALLIVSTLLALSPASSVLASFLYEYYNTGDDNFSTCLGGSWKGQTFTPSQDYAITSVKFLIYRTGSPGTIDVSIKATSGGFPTGTALCSGSTNANTLTTAPAGEWREITFGSSATLTQDVVYAVELKALTADGNNTVYMREDRTAPTYTRGNYIYSNDSGQTWGEVLGRDFMFETWGSDPNIPTATTQPATDVEYNPYFEWFEATLNGTVTSEGGEPCSVAFQYREVGESLRWASVSGLYETSETFDIDLNNLDPDTDYEFFALAINQYGDSLNTMLNREFELGNPPDDWTAVGSGATFVRSNEQKMFGTYSGKLTRAGTDCYIKQDVSNYTDFQDEKVILGMWVYATIASRARLAIYDGANTAYSSYHTGSSSWEWLDMSFDVDASATQLSLRGQLNTGDTSVYFDTGYVTRLETFTTLYDTAIPIMSTFSFPILKDAEDLECRIYGKVEVDGNSDTDIHFRYREFNITWGTWTDTTPDQEDLGTGDEFNELLTGLGVYPITYEYQAVGTNVTGTGYGGVSSFYLIDVDTPTLTTDSYNLLTDTSVYLYLTITDDGGRPGGCFAQMQYREAGKQVWITSPGYYLETNEEGLYGIEDLTPATNYEYRGYAWVYDDEWTMLEAWGDIRTFATLGEVSVPVLTTKEAQYITDTCVILYATLDYTGSLDCYLGFQYRLPSSSVWTETDLVFSATSPVDYARPVINLVTNYDYEYRAFGVNDEGYGYGEIAKFRISGGTIVIPKPLIPWIDDAPWRPIVDGLTDTAKGVCCLIFLALVWFFSRRLWHRSWLTIGLLAISFYFMVIIHLMPIWLSLAVALGLGIYIFKVVKR